MDHREKEQYAVSDSADYNGHSHNAYVDPHTGAETKAGRIEAAAEVYGSIDDAERYGYVQRGLVCPILNSTSLLTEFPKTQVSTHPVHRIRWNDWYGSLLGYRLCLYSCWPSCK